MNKILDVYMRSVPYTDTFVEYVSHIPIDAVYIYHYPIYAHGIRDELYILDNVVYRKRFRLHLSEPGICIVKLI
jgi:hypothetical protein